MLEKPQKILLTGGTSGIGLELLRQLNQKGHSMIVLGRDADKLAQLRRNFVDVETYCCDLAQKHELESVLNEIRTTHPTISILINNAAVQNTPAFTAPDFEYDTLTSEVEINFLAPVRLTYLLLDGFLKQERPCAIVNISSGLALYPKASSSIYCATKAALHSFSQSLRYQLHKHPVRVIEVLLPLVDTPMTAGRGRRKLSAGDAAAHILLGISGSKGEIYIGRARWLPLLIRVSPGIAKGILRRA